MIVWPTEAEAHCSCLALQKHSSQVSLAKENSKIKVQLLLLNTYNSHTLIKLKTTGLSQRQSRDMAESETQGREDDLEEVAVKLGFGKIIKL